MRVLAEHACCSIYGEKVRYVEFSDELNANLASVDVEVHSLKVTFDDFSSEVSH